MKLLLCAWAAPLRIGAIAHSVMVMVEHSAYSLAPPYAPRWVVYDMHLVGSGVNGITDVTLRRGINGSRHITDMLGDSHPSNRRWPAASIRG